MNVETGEFRLDGILQGSLAVKGGVTAHIGGAQQGSVSLEDRAVVFITGAIEGSRHVSRGGTLIVEETGRLAGSLTNDGQVIVRGVFGGSYVGGGRLNLQGNGYIKQPMIRHEVAY